MLRPSGSARRRQSRLLRPFALPTVRRLPSLRTMRRSRLFMAALLAAAIAACHRAPSGAVQIGSIAVSDATVSGTPELGLQADQVRKLTMRALEDTRRFAVREGASARIRLEIESARRVTAPSLNGPDRELADVEL